jgi:hypothetical protein
LALTPFHGIFCRLYVNGDILGPPPGKATKRICFALTETTTQQGRQRHDTAAHAADTASDTNADDAASDTNAADAANKTDAADAMYSTVGVVGVCGSVYGAVTSQRKTTETYCRLDDADIVYTRISMVQTYVRCVSFDSVRV